MMYQDKIIIHGLRQNTLKNVSLDIPKGKIVVFTGVSGSGKSSIVFDTIAAESQRQMNETYTAFMRGRLPKYEKPKVERIDNLSASVIVDQSRLFGSREPGGPREHKKVEGIKTQFQRLCLMKGPEEQNDHTLKKLNQFMEP